MSIIFEPARNTQSRYQFPTPKQALGEDVSFYFPGDLCLRIIQYLIGSDFQRSSEDIGSIYLVSRNWTALLSSLEYTEPIKIVLIAAFSFNKLKWEEYIGDVGEEPFLPADMHQILQNQCPIWPGKTVAQTHLLTLVPKTVNGEPLTLKTLGEFVQHPKQGGHATEYRNFSPGGQENTPASESHWVLMARDVIPNSRSKSYTDQQQLAQTYNKNGIGYEVPKLLDTIVGIFMEYVRTGERLFSDNPWTFTRCQEIDENKGKWQMVVGGFSASGVGVYDSDFDCDAEIRGISLFRKFS